MAHEVVSVEHVAAEFDAERTPIYHGAIRHLLDTCRYEGAGGFRSFSTAREIAVLAARTQSAQLGGQQDVCSHPADRVGEVLALGVDGAGTMAASPAGRCSPGIPVGRASLRRSLGQPAPVPGQTSAWCGCLPPRPRNDSR